MMDEKKIITMTKIAMMEKREGMDMFRVISHRKIDYVLTEIFKGAISGTVCYLILLVFWFFYLWDSLNDFIVNLNVEELLSDLVLRYIIFMAIYLVICAIAAFRRHTLRMEHRYAYLHYLKELKNFYDPERKSGSVSGTSGKTREHRRGRQEEV